MSLDPPAYLFTRQANIRNRPISWEGAIRAKTITDADLQKIKSVNKVRKEERKQKIEEDTQSFVTLLLGGNGSQSIFEAVAKRQDIVQYMLVLTEDLMSDSPSLTAALAQHPAPFKPFLPLLKASNADDTIPLLTSSVLSKFLSYALTQPSKDSSQTDEALLQLYNYLSALAKSSDAGLQDIAVQGYSAVLRNRKSRELFWDQRKETLEPLIETLRAASGVGKDQDSTIGGSGGAGSIRSVPEGLSGGVGLQLLYHMLLVIWLLSFEGELVGDGLDEEYDIVPLYTNLLRLSPKEKTTRLLLATLLNLLTSNRQTLLPAAVLARLPALLTTLKSRHLTDEDALEDLQSLNDLLEDYTTTQTTFDEYAAELNSGTLRWSPPHRNPTFWRENARRILEDNKGELPRKLAEILSKNWDENKQVLAIGCNDVACLVKEVPEKRYQLEKLGLKGRVMELMTEADETVRWESLRAVGEWLRYSFESKSNLPLR